MHQLHRFWFNNMLEISSFPVNTELPLLWQQCYMTLLHHNICNQTPNDGHVDCFPIFHLNDTEMKLLVRSSLCTDLVGSLIKILHMTLAEQGYTDIHMCCQTVFKNVVPVYILFSYSLAIQIWFLQWKLLGQWGLCFRVWVVCNIGTYFVH